MRGQWTGLGFINKVEGEGEGGNDPKLPPYVAEPKEDQCEDRKGE